VRALASTTARPGFGFSGRRKCRLLVLAGLLLGGPASARTSECRTATLCLARFVKSSASGKTGARPEQDASVRRFLEMAPEPITPLAELLGHHNKRVREAAARTLGALGPRARPAFQALAEAADRGVRGAAAALAELGDPAAIPFIAGAIRRRQADPQLLARFGGAGVATFAELAGNPDSSAVARNRRRMGQDARVSVASLHAIAANPSQSGQARTFALEALCRQGTVSPETAALVLALQGDPDSTLRYAVEGCLVRIGDPGALERALQEDANTYRYGRGAALAWIASVGPVAATVAGTVQGILEHGRWYEQPAAARALGRIGARQAIPALVAALATNNWRLTTSAAEALGLLDDGTSAARPALRKLASEHWLPRTRETAARALRRIESAGRPVAAESVLADTGFEGDGPPTWSDPCDSRTGWEIRLDGEWQRIERGEPHTLDASAATLPATFLRRARPRAGRLPMVAVEDGWIVGTNRGELDGELQLVLPSGASRVLWPRNVSHVFRVGDSLIALVGLRHGFWDQGTMLRIRRQGVTGDGWFAEPVAELPGYAARSLVLSSARILVLTGHGVVVVDGQGKLRPVECRNRNQELQAILQKLLGDPMIAGRAPGATFEPTRWLFFPGDRDAEVLFRLVPGGSGLATLHRDAAGWRVLTIEAGATPAAASPDRPAPDGAR
jgi:HEAT repeat protein